jgi:hypothetical protein
MVLEAIESIKQQDYSQLEIIVVNDGSTDDTKIEIETMFPEAHLLQVDGLGPGPARNAGVKSSSGDILMFLDSDDLWLENHVKNLVDAMKRGFQVAYGATKTINEIDGNEFFIPDNGKGIEGDCFEPLLRWCFLVPSALAVSRKAFQTVNGFDDVACGEDWTFLLKLSAHFHFGYTGPSPITLRRLHHGSLCFLSDKKKLLAIINQIFTFIENEPRATTAHYEHFTKLHDWTAANMDQLTTVQDWYLQMVREEII